MYKAKTRKNLFTILSAVLGVVFAFITGMTYCATSLNLIYGTKENSTSAYMGNQQYYVINDTVNNPIQFNDGAHNFEIALQYSFDYSFDLRVEYSLKWSNDESSDNVILNFANRDNIIYDENYIYFANSFTAGSGKISIIAGVDFVDVEDATYNGATLQIVLGDQSYDGIKIRKAQTKYDGIPSMISDVVDVDDNNNITAFDSDAAQTWLQYKLNKTAEGAVGAYAMMYNYRRDYAHGFQYPGNATAYKKPVATKTEGNYTINNVYGSVRTVGNRGYAGTGMYVIAGSTNLDLEIEVAGIWRNKDKAELNTENNIQFNYAEGWEFNRYSLENDDKNTGLWDVRTFNFYIPAKTGCYIDILDSLEITSAGVHTTSEYRLVINSIKVNSTAFAYGESSEITKFAGITTKTSSKTEEFKYEQNNISVINTTKYNNGLYDATAGKQQLFNGNISLINNTSEAKDLTINLGMNYHISNGKTKLYADGDADKKRAIDLIDRTENSAYTYLSAFSAQTTNSAVNTLYYSCNINADSYLTQVNNMAKTATYTITIAPYSSVNLLNSYSVGADLAGAVMNMFDQTGIDNPKSAENSNTADDDSRYDYYDVWTYLVPSVDDSGSSTAPNLVLETRQTETTTIVSVKNNTNNTITGINISNFALRVYSELKSGIETSQPNDWEASYWKYYAVDTNKALTTLPTEFDSDGYYTVTKSYHNFVINTEKDNENYSLNGFSFGTTGNAIDTTKLIDADKTLLPGESVDVITLNTTGKVFATGYVETTTVSTETDLTIINNGSSKAYVVNYSANAYYLKLSGKHTGVSFKTYDGEDFTYYIGIVRPGQIIELSMTSVGEISTIAIDYTESGNYGEFNSSNLTDWSENAKNSMIRYFNINKNI